MLPFDAYDHGGSQPQHRSDVSYSNCRKVYAIPIVEQCGTACAYCGRELIAAYESWLDLSVDHVVPFSAAAPETNPEQRDWIANGFNQVICCRACNEFLNGFRVKQGVPPTLEEFVQLRDSVYLEKRERALLRHEQERRWYREWMAKRVASDRS